MSKLGETELLDQRRNRVTLIVLLLGLVTLGHFLLPVTSHTYHVGHVVLEKLFFLPILLAAVWFDLRGAMLTAIVAAGIYALHVLLQWRGQVGVNINQVGELVSMAIVAAVAGIVIGREKKAMHDLADLQEGTTLALVCALDAREHQTQAHSLRVCFYALRLARDLGLSLSRVQILAHAAILHDIGKIGIPDRVLLKPAPLTQDEWAMMHEHPAIGHRILQRIPPLHPAAEVVLAHHEKFDGSGYPRGLRGLDIPLEARIFALADALDALTADRPYRRATSFEEAQQVIAKAKGSHFDPEVTEVFLRVPVGEWPHLRDRADVHGGPGETFAHLVVAPSGELWMG